MELLQTTAPRSMLYRTSAGFTTNIDCRQGMDAASTCINSLQLTERSSHDTVDSTEISSNQKEQGNDRRQDTPAAKQQACAQNSAPAANWLGLLYIRNYLSQFVWATQIVSHRAPPSIKWDQALSDVLCLDQTCSLEKATDHLISIYYESTYDIICFKLSCDDQDPESHRKYLQMVTYYSSNSKIGVHIPSPNNPYHMRHLYVFAQAPNQPWLEIFDIIEPQNFERKGETADRAWLFMFVTFKTRKSHRHPRKRGSLAPSPPHSPPPKSVESGSEDGDSGDEDSKNPTINASDPAADHRHTTSSLSSEKGSGSRRVHWKKDLVGMADPPQWYLLLRNLDVSSSSVADDGISGGGSIRSDGSDTWNPPVDAGDPDLAFDTPCVASITSDAAIPTTIPVPATGHGGNGGEITTIHQDIKPEVVDPIINIPGESAAGSGGGVVDDHTVRTSGDSGSISSSNGTSSSEVEGGGTYCSSIAAGGNETKEPDAVAGAVTATTSTEYGDMKVHEPGRTSNYSAQSPFLSPPLSSSEARPEAGTGLNYATTLDILIECLNSGEGQLGRKFPHSDQLVALSPEHLVLIDSLSVAFPPLNASLLLQKVPPHLLFDFSEHALKLVGKSDSDDTATVSSPPHPPACPSPLTVPSNDHKEHEYQAPALANLANHEPSRSTDDPNYPHHQAKRKMEAVNIDTQIMSRPFKILRHG